MNADDEHVDVPCDMRELWLDRPPKPAAPKCEPWSTATTTRKAQWFRRKFRLLNMWVVNLGEKGFGGTAVIRRRNWTRKIIQIIYGQKVVLVKILMLMVNMVNVMRFMAHCRGSKEM